MSLFHVTRVFVYLFLILRVAFSWELCGHQFSPAMDWMPVWTSPTDSYAEIPTSRVTVLRRGDLWKVRWSCVWSPREWYQCPYTKESWIYLSALCHMRIQQEDNHLQTRKHALPRHWAYGSLNLKGCSAARPGRYPGLCRCDLHHLIYSTLA